MNLLITRMRPSILLSIVTIISSFAGERERCTGLDSFYITDCCYSTLASCSKNHPACAIAQHLKKFSFWIDSIQSEKPCSSRVAALAERYAGFADTVVHTIDVREVAFVGSPDAPVTLLLYVSALCPLCKKVYKELYDEVTGGSLQNKARIGIKVFSERPGDIALLAAKKFNKQSEFLLSLAGVEERITGKIIMQKAREIGLPMREFSLMLKDSVLKNAAQVSSREASENGVTVTPTIFINGKRYHSYKNPEWIADAVLYEYETNAAKANNR